MELYFLFWFFVAITIGLIHIFATLQEFFISPELLLLDEAIYSSAIAAPLTIYFVGFTLSLLFRENKYLLHYDNLFHKGNDFTFFKNEQYFVFVCYLFIYYFSGAMIINTVFFLAPFKNILLISSFLTLFNMIFLFFNFNIEKKYNIKKLLKKGTRTKEELEYIFDIIDSDKIKKETKYRIVKNNIDSFQKIGYLKILKYAKEEELYDLKEYIYKTFSVSVIFNAHYLNNPYSFYNLFEKNDEMEDRLIKSRICYEIMKSQYLKYSNCFATNNLEEKLKEKNLDKKLELETI
tara:strand:+ start:8283 stop:9158 length:876 start_codon:yes stop_codon:yes gene_type:complete